MPTLITAGDASNGVVVTSSNDNALTIQTGPNGGKVNAVSFASDGTPTFLKARSMAQIQTFQTGAVATGTTTIPGDNTIPQNTEGDQYLSVSITPISAASLLEITVVLNMCNSAASTGVIALFQDSTANALAASIGLIGTDDGQISLTHVMTAGTTSTTTFKVRAGATSAGTTTINGSAGAQWFNGVMASRITVKEYLP